jgi:hypothetical protein
MSVKANNAAKIPKRIFAMDAAPAAIPVNPKIAATIAMIKNANDQRNIILSFYCLPHGKQVIIAFYCQKSVPVFKQPVTNIITKSLGKTWGNNASFGECTSDLLRLFLNGANIATQKITGEFF